MDKAVGKPKAAHLWELDGPLGNIAVRPHKQEGVNEVLVFTKPCPAGWVVPTQDCSPNCREAEGVKGMATSHQPALVVS